MLTLFVLVPIVCAIAMFWRAALRDAKKQSVIEQPAPAVAPAYVMTPEEKKEFERLSSEIDQIKEESDKKIQEKTLRMAELVTGLSLKEAK